MAPPGGGFGEFHSHIEVPFYSWQLPVSLRQNDLGLPPESLARTVLQQPQEPLGVAVHEFMQGLFSQLLPEGSTCAFAFLYTRL